MSESINKKEALTPAQLASFGISPRQAEGPRLVQERDPAMADGADKSPEPMQFFSESETGEFRSQWRTLQTGFVDEPFATVEGADRLAASVLQKLAEGLVDERLDLVEQWDRSENVSTEELRIALQSYRSFLNRLLKLD